MHRSIRRTRTLAVAAAVVTVGALALPVSAAFAQDGDDTGSEGTSVATSPSTDQTDSDQTETEQTETEQSSDDASEADEVEAEAPKTGDDADEASTGHSTDAPAPDAPAAPAAPAKPWHVKARLTDRDSAVVAWRDADSTGVSFTIALVPVGGATATALTPLTGSATTRSVQFDGLVAGARYRATVTAVTDGGTVASAPSNVLVAPKAKHGKAGDHAEHAKQVHAKHEHATKAGTHEKPAKHAKAGTHGKAATHAKHIARTRTHGKHGR